jgi:glucokinase
MSTQPSDGRRPRSVSPIRHAVMLEINGYLVLDHVREVGETTRPALAAQLGLSAASVSRIVRRLIGEGLISEGPGSSTGGRPRSVLRFNTRAGCVIGVDLGGTRCHGLLADLGGAPLAEDIRPTGADEEPFAVLVATIRALQARASEQGLPVAALAVGVAAIVDPDTGIASGGPTVRWDDFPIVSALADAVDLPFVVDNDVNLAALAHAWRGDGRGLANFAVLELGTGIGAAIVSEGRLLKGHGNAVGEIGYLVLDRALLRDGRRDGPGVFERQASGPAIEQSARIRSQTGSPRTRGAMPEHPSAADVFVAALAGDPTARLIIDEVVDHVAMALIALASTVDPEVIILGGPVGGALVPWLDELGGLLAKHLPTPPPVVASTLGPDAAAIGAVAAALQLAREQGSPGVFFDTTATAAGRDGRPVVVGDVA